MYIYISYDLLLVLCIVWCRSEIQELQRLKRNFLALNWLNFQFGFDSNKRARWRRREKINSEWSVTSRHNDALVLFIIPLFFYRPKNFPCWYFSIGVAFCDIVRLRRHRHTCSYSHINVYCVRYFECSLTHSHSSLIWLCFSQSRFSLLFIVPLAWILNKGQLHYESIARKHVI